MKYLLSTALTAAVLFTGPAMAYTAEENRRLNIWGNITTPDGERRYEEQRRKVEAERRAQEEEATRKAAIAAAVPANQIFRGYMAYVHVKLCNDVRQGYAVQYVNDIELERSAEASKAIAERAMRMDTSIDSDEVWKESVRIVNKEVSVDHFSCRRSLNYLLQSSPEPVYKVEKP